MSGPLETGSPCRYCRHALLLRLRSRRSSGRGGVCGTCGAGATGEDCCSDGKAARGRGLEMDDCRGRDGPASAFSDGVGDEGLWRVRRRLGLDLGAEFAGDGCACACADPLAFRTEQWRAFE